MRVFALPCLLLLALYTPTARAADCMAASQAVDVGDRLKAAEVALQAGDPDGFQGALEEVTLLLPCLADALPPDVSAELHRLVGVQMFTRERQLLRLYGPVLDVPRGVQVASTRVLPAPP